MARLQMEYPAMGTSSMELFVPQYGDAAHHRNLSEKEFYSRKFPVLWLLHREGGSGGDWGRFTLVEQYAAQKDCIVVCPTLENSFGLNIARGDPWEDFLTTTLRQLVFDMLPASRKPEDTYIAGASMGGYAALRLGLLHPDQYSVAGSLSGITDLPADTLNWQEPQLRYVFGSPDAVQEEAFALKRLISPASPSLFLAESRPGRPLEAVRELAACRREAGGTAVVWEAAQPEGWFGIDRQLQAFFEFLP